MTEELLAINTRVLVGIPPQGNQLDDRLYGRVKGIQAYEPPVSYLVIFEDDVTPNQWVRADIVTPTDEAPIPLDNGNTIEPV